MKITLPDLAGPMAITETGLRQLRAAIPAALERLARLDQRKCGDGETEDLPMVEDCIDPEPVGSTAVMSISGPIISGCDPWLASYLGCCRTEDITEACDKLAADDSISRVVMKIDSPGGSVAGSADMLAAVKRLADAKELHAIASDCACSMAYMIAAQAASIAATPTATVGAIGVIATLVDSSEAYKQEGLERVVFSSGTLKSAGVDGAPITDAQRLMMSKLVDGAAKYLVGLVADGRGVDAPVIASYEGAVFSADDAKGRRLVDVVSTTDDFIRSIAERRGPGPGGTSTAAKVPGRGGAYAMAKETQLPSTPDELKATAPEFYAQVGDHFARSQGLVKPEKAATPADLKAAFPDDAAFALDAMVAGLTLTAAQAKYADVLKARNSELAVKVREAEAKAATAQAAPIVNPVLATITPGAPAAGATVTAGGAGNQPQDIMAAAKLIQARDGCNFRDAMSKAHREHPDLSALARTQGVR